MRFAILIALAASGWVVSTASADDLALIHVKLGSRDGYIVPEAYAEAHKADLIAGMTGPVTIEGFWTPPEQDVAVADRVFRDTIHAAAKDPTVLFPELAPDPDPTVPVNEEATRELQRQRSELALISENYDSYARQFVGIIIDKEKLVFCNYSVGTNLDPAAGYIFIHKTFASDGTVRFLQCRFEPLEKTVANVSFVGSWSPPAK